MLFENFEAYDVQETRRISRAEGKAEGKAEAILELLSDLGKIPETVKEDILQEKDSSLLTKWLKTAARAESVEQFLEVMELGNPAE